MIGGTRPDIKPALIDMWREMEDTKKINKTELTEVASKDSIKRKFHFEKLTSDQKWQKMDLKDVAKNSTKIK